MILAASISKIKIWSAFKKRRNLSYTSTLYFKHRHFPFFIPHKEPLYLLLETSIYSSICTMYADCLFWIRIQKIFPVLLKTKRGVRHIVTYPSITRNETRVENQFVGRCDCCPCDGEQLPVKNKNNTFVGT